MNDRGWYCHATGQGGGPIELVQRLHPGMHCYAAGRWLWEHGVSSLVEDVREGVEAALDETPALTALEENAPIRQDLRKLLDPDHAAFTQRGISPTVLRDLGAGYLERAARQNGRPDPMSHRLVFQIRGVRHHEDRGWHSVILGHIGRATTLKQEQQDGKWWTYAGFRKSLELYNLDLVLLEGGAREQARHTGHVLVVEGCFDVAKLRAAGIHDAVATFGANLSPAQSDRLALLSKLVGIERFLFFYDRDEAGSTGTRKALETLAATHPDLRAKAFDWERTWPSPVRGDVGIPDSISDPCDFTIEQLRWLRLRRII